MTKENRSRFYLMLDGFMKITKDWEQKENYIESILNGCRTSIDIENCLPIVENVNKQINKSYEDFIDAHKVVNFISFLELRVFMEERKNDMISRINSLYGDVYADKLNFEEEHYKTIKNNE